MEEMSCMRSEKRKKEVKKMKIGGLELRWNSCSYRFYMSEEDLVEGYQRWEAIFYCFHWGATRPKRNNVYTEPWYYKWKYDGRWRRTMYLPWGKLTFGFDYEDIQLESEYGW